MDFNKYCAVLFKGNEQKAIQQLASHGYHKDYRLVENEEAHQAILTSMTKKQAKAYMAEFQRLARENGKKQTSGGKKGWGMIIIAIIFLFAAVFTFITEYTNIAKTNELNQEGVLVKISVIDEEYDSINEDYTYTLSYSIDGKKYTYVGWPRQRYDVGDTFELYIDPEHPRDLVFSSSGDILLSFIPLSISIFCLFCSGRFWWLAKYLAYIIIIFAAVLVGSGIMLDVLGLTITGSVILVVTTIVWLRTHRINRKQQNET